MKEPFRGKASGKTRGFQCQECMGWVPDASHHHCWEECKVYERIAELEAELAAHRIAKDTKNPAGYRVVPGGLYDEAVARAEKAEAEVERLRTGHCQYCGSPWFVRGDGVRVTIVPKRGGRDGSLSSGKPRESDVAANPAAPSCNDTTHTVVHSEGEVCPFLVPRAPAARKGRDER